MTRFPVSSAPLYFLMDPTFKYSLTNGSNLVSSCVNQITQLPVLQLTAANQPTLTTSGLAGQYRSTNVPGTNTITCLSFLGSASMEYDALATTFSGADPGISVTVVASCTSPSTGTQTIFSFVGSSTSLVLQYNSGNIVFKEVNTGGTTTLTVATDAKLHVFTATRTATALTLRADGVQVGTTALTTASETFTTFCLGATNTAGSFSNYLTGTIGIVAVYGASAAVAPGEIKLLLDVGIIRSGSQGLNTGF